ncbi:MAG: hypothetical protein U0Z26_02455 [Anaerolineales bacterium]
MIPSIHKQMTQDALAGSMSDRAIELVIAANLKQDALRGQIGHDEFHFDNNAFDKGNAYVKEQRGYVLASLLSPGVLSAWIAFGRLTHAVQDFYSHTNYISMWLDQYKGTPPPPLEIDPLQKDILASPNMHSGKVYLPWDALYFIPFTKKLALKMLPEDSHGKMNLDSPSQGPRFEYARAAAVKRTAYEFDLLKKILTPDLFAKFADL